MMKSVSVIFYTGYTYLCYAKNRYFADIEESVLPKFLKGIVKGLDVYVYSIVWYSFRNEIERVIIR